MDEAHYQGEHGYEDEGRGCPLWIAQPKEERKEIMCRWRSCRTSRKDKYLKMSNINKVSFKFELQAGERAPTVCEVSAIGGGRGH